MKIIYSSVKKIISIFLKEKIDIFRNKKMLMMFLIFPIIAIFYTNVDVGTDQLSGMVFMVMNVIMPPLTCISGTVSEEREKGTLRSLIFAGVKPYEYFIGIGICMGLFNFIGTCIIGMVYNNSSPDAGSVLIVAMISIVCSMILGANIGISAKNQISASSMAAPISLALGMLALFGLGNDNIHKYTQYIYTQAVTDMILKNEVTIKGISVMIINAVILFGIFVAIYMRRYKAD